ncbi:MAG: hypothetical protein SGI72_17010 [Planctomycetota bacterium]|nr:hypothetical protein [Planctomycetota bacterium]
MSGAQIPGSGGISRGRGDAPLTWGAETPGATDRFEAKSLPDAEYRDPEHSTVVGVGVAAPTVEPTAESAGLVDVSASGGRTAWKRRLAPHHRRAVQTYFTRDTAQKQ